jgi:hypothetical protein
VRLEETALVTKTNTEGRLTVRHEVPAGVQGQDDENTSFENFEDLTNKLLRVPKDEVDEKLAERKEARRRKQG